MSVQKFTLLLIDDSAEDIELAIRALRNNRFIEKIIHFKNGAEALNFLLGKSSFNFADVLILLDMNMPGMGGLEFITKVKANEKIKKIPIAVLTATTELPDIKESMRLGVQFYIPKPLESEDIDKIAQQLNLPSLA